uniref:Kinetochore protein NUF2 n=1 Tax=Photinus pyralis TaxID=7054 RepID=A0A1Y1NKI6_PHOPY
MESADELWLQFINQYWPDFENDNEKLQNPSSEHVIECYQRVRQIICTLFTQATGEDVTVPATSVETDSMCNLLGFINRFLKNHSGVDCSLTLTDLYAPTAKRTETKMRILMNILIVFYSNVNDIKSVIQRQRELSTKTSETQKRVVQLQTNLAENAEAHAKLLDEEEKLQRKFKDVEARYKNLQGQQEDNDRHCKQLQQELKTVVDTYQNKETLAKNLKANIAICNEQITNVETYKSLQDLLENLRVKQSTLEEEVSGAAERIDHKKPEIDQLTAVQEKIEMLEEGSALIKSLQEDVTHYENKIKLQQAKYDKIRKTIETNRASILQINTKLKEKNVATRTNLEELNVAIQALHCKIDKINSEISKEKDKQKKLCEFKEQIERKVAEGERDLLEKHRNLNMLKERTLCMYENIMAAENPLATEFIDALKELKSVVEGSR